MHGEKPREVSDKSCCLLMKSITHLLNYIYSVLLPGQTLIYRLHFAKYSLRKLKCGKDLYKTSHHLPSCIWEKTVITDGCLPRTLNTGCIHGCFSTADTLWLSYQIQLYVSRSWLSLSSPYKASTCVQHLCHLWHFFATMSKDQCDDLWSDPICHYYTEGTTDSSIGILRCALDDICV